MLDALTYAGNLATSPSDGRRARLFVHGDIRDPAVVRASSARHDIERVVHLAAESHVDRSIDGPAAFIETNVVGTLNLLDAARAHWRAGAGAARFRFQHVSTDEVFGSLGADDGRSTRRTPYAPNSPYAAARRRPIIWCAPGTTPTACPRSMTNCSNNYGPWQFPEKLIPLMILNALRGQAAAGLRRRLQRARLALRRRPRRRAARACSTRGAPGRHLRIGGDSERSNLEVVRGDLRPASTSWPGAAGPRAR